MLIGQPQRVQVGAGALMQGDNLFTGHGLDSFASISPSRSAAPAATAPRQKLSGLGVPGIQHGLALVDPAAAVLETDAGAPLKRSHAMLFNGTGRQEVIRAGRFVRRHKADLL